MVAHHKVLAIRYGEGSEIVQITGTIVIIDVRFVILLVIDIEITVLNADGVSGKPDDALDEIRISASGITADHHIKALGIAKGGYTPADEIKAGIAQF